MRMTRMMEKAIMPAPRADMPPASEVAAAEDKMTLDDASAEGAAVGRVKGASVGCNEGLAKGGSVGLIDGSGLLVGAAVGSVE